MDSAQMRAHLGSIVKGQDDLLDDLCPFLAERLTQPAVRRPLASLCLLGEAATGKTTLVRALAEYLQPHQRSLLRFDCDELMTPEGSVRLIGYPPHYSWAGGSREGQLTGPLLENPKRVLVFDHFERAHSSVREILLEMLTRGHLTDAPSGRIADLSDAVVILTTYLNTYATDDEGEFTNTMQAILARSPQRPVDPALAWILQSVDKVCVFRPLTSIAVLEIAVQQAAKMAMDYGLELAWIDPDVLFQAATGGRFHPRLVDRELSDRLCDELLAAKEAGWQRVRIELKRGRPAATPAP